jgi:CheY-like chemotaxis protein
MQAKPAWQMELLRQRERLDADLLSREIGVTLTCLLFAQYLPLVFICSVYAICLLTELIQHGLFQRFQHAPNRLLQVLIIGNSTIGLVAYSAPALLVWGFDDPLVRFAGAISLVGAIVNVVSVRSAHLPLAVAAGLPPALALLWLPAQTLHLGTISPGEALATASVCTLLGYFASALLQNYRAEARLARAREAAEAGSRAKSRFLAAMSHEIRTPLNTIIGLGQAIQDDPTLVRVAPQAEEIEAAGRRLQMMVDDVLDLAAAQEGETKLRVVTADLRREVSAAIDTAMYKQPHFDTVPHIHFDADLPELARFDPMQLRKAVQHACAILRQAAAPIVDMTLRAEAGVIHDSAARLLVTLCVVPNGAGEAGLPRVLGTPTASQNVADSSLAATLLGRITDLFKGRFDLRHMPDGSLAADLEMPFYPVPALPDPDSVAATRAIRVLVVDDLATNRFVVMQILKLLHITAIEADNGRTALDLLERADFDLILLDMNMPDMNGEAVFRAIRASLAPWSGIPIVALTADAMAEQRDRYLALGLNGYVPKPVDKRLLWAEIVANLPGRDDI